MPEIYIGTDLVDVNRIRSAMERNKDRFITRVFTLSEQEYCQSKADPAIHFSGRFAAKEAIMKALKSGGWDHPVPFNSISIDPIDSGAPMVSLDFIINGECRVSISHTDDQALAFAIFLPHK